MYVDTWSMLPNKTEPKWAKSTLHGLSDYVLQNKTTSLSDNRLVAFAGGKQLDYDRDDSDGIATQWEALAREFVVNRHCLEADLYQSKGAKLKDILHHHDQSEFANTCGGVMALLQFS